MLTHGPCSVGVLIATVSDPDNFANFSSSSGQQQLVVQYFETQGEGAFCAPINISAANIPGVQSGANVTVQFVFDGGDGELYQVRAPVLSAVCSTRSRALCCSVRT